MQPKVSVIIPIYNVERYLEKCLDSILKQTLDPIEIICVDDGSTDATPQMLARFAELHGNLRVLRQENAGSSVARNHGLDVATGDYIYFMDSDDWLTGPDALETLYARAKELRLDELDFNATGTFENAELAASKAGVLKCYRFAAEYPEEAVLDGPSTLVLQSERGDFRPYLWRRLYRRAFLEEHHLRFIEGIVHQDHIFTLECIALAKRVACVNATYYNRHIRPDSITTGTSRRKTIYARCVGAIALRDFARKHFDGANPDFERAFNADIHAWESENARFYLALSREQRRELWRFIPEAKRAGIAKYFRPVVRRERARKLLAAVRRRIPRRSK